MLEINKEFYRNVIVHNVNPSNDFAGIHNAVMNEKFCDEMIREFTKDGETVLDPFMGLCTTGISCYRYDRDFIGIEIYEKYYEIAKKRLDDEMAQIRWKF